MKRITFKVIFSVFATALLLSSCLGDGESTSKQENVFAYMSTGDTGQTIASTPIGQMTSASMSDFTVGRCYFVNYEINLSNNSNGIYTAEYIRPTNSNGQAISESKFRTIPVPAATDDAIVAKGIGIPFFHGTDYYGDNWLFSYSFSVKPDDIVEAEFYYDSTNQIDEDGTEIKNTEDKVIIDIRFKKTYSQAGEATTIPKTFTSVTKLSVLRGSFPRPNNPSPIVQGDYTLIPIKFRYWEPASKAGDPDKLRYVGTWELLTTTSNQVYYLMKENK
ncbi:hypothetical protein [Dysgonomonas sp. ZJ279]|uniref:hypothetical protein n=1 Tax=Dysgonomonas sp. ZJ279 TaxID=2709796 RepID=UPI0013EA8443|nr:hypothetical protein [Dysgonomonas sp. ZJ279]